MITFDVSPVELNRCPLIGTDLFTSLEGRLNAPVVACGANMARIVTIPRVANPNFKPTRWASEAWAREPHPGFARWNGFVTALGVAFAGHYPLALSPDDIWLCIAQGFAMHVNQHPEVLRSRLVQHEGRAPLHVDGDGIFERAPTNPWPEVISQLSDGLASYIGKKRDLLVANFSTTGVVERTATEIVLMDAMHSYFLYHVGGLCGIPRITLHGTADDWRSIRLRAQNLLEYQIDDWARALLPILDQIVTTAEGRPSVEFWRRMYRSQEVCGVRLVDGWCNVLFPYLNSSTRPDRVTRNTYLNFWHQVADRGDWDWLGEGDWDWMTKAMDLGYALAERGEDIDDDNFPPRVENFPSGLSAAPFTWLRDNEEIPMEFLGGFTGVTQHKDLSIQPVIGWALRGRST